MVFPETPCLLAPSGGTEPPKLVEEALHERVLVKLKVHTPECANPHNLRAELVVVQEERSDADEELIVQEDVLVLQESLWLTSSCRWSLRLLAPR